MKRFYCAKCKKIKHVRRLPDGMSTDTSHDTAPTEHHRVGVCRFHETEASRPEINSRVHVVAGFGSTRKTSSSAAKSKSKK